MPPAVKAAVDLIRQGMGLMPQEWMPESRSSVIGPPQSTLVYHPEGSQCVVNDEHYRVDDENCSQLGGEGELRGETLTLTLQCLGICKGGSACGGGSSPETAQETL